MIEKPNEGMAVDSHTENRKDKESSRVSTHTQQSIRKKVEKRS